MRAGIFAAAHVEAMSADAVTFQQFTVETLNNSTFTFPDQAIGPAASDRRVVVALTTASARLATGVTIGGVTATIDGARTLGGTAYLAIASAVVPTGTTAEVVVTLNGSANYMGIGLWTLTGGSPTGQTADANGNPLSLPVTTAVGDVVIAVSHTTGQATAIFLWTGATERWTSDTEGSVETYSGADTVATGATTTVDLDPSGTTVALAVAYG